MNVALAAEESAGLHMLRVLARSDYRVVAVLTTPPEAGSAKVGLWNIARDFGFETLPAELVRDPDLAGKLRSKDVDILLNVHSLYIINREVLAAPKLGAFNLHPGPLPRYAGLNSVSWALFRGEQSYGVTVHRMEPEVDAGPIAYQSSFPIEAEDSALSLTFKCTREGIQLMLRLLEAAASKPEQIPVLPQDPALREYFGADVPEQGRMSWSWPASKVLNFVRACDYFPFRSPWGHPRTNLGAQELALVKARRTGLPSDAVPGTVGKPAGLDLCVACNDEWIVASKLRLGDKYVDANAVLKPGDRLSD
jgi:methionyl-tRNA formyltransferase